jgi:hypothetical protein
MSSNAQSTRVLARTKARTLSQDELDLVAGGGPKGGSQPTRNCYWDRGQYICYETADAGGIEWDFPF